jgi:hypothetical protein
LVAENPFSFGGEHRYYGSQTAPDPAAASSGVNGEIRSGSGANLVTGNLLGQ